MVGLRASIPDDAFTAETLGTERAGNGVVIRDGLVLTIGYLITEAETIWLTSATAARSPATCSAYDQETGFGLVQALAPARAAGAALGDSARPQVGERSWSPAPAAASIRSPPRIVAKQEFAGYWEYVLDEAIFTAPAHPVLGRRRADRPGRRPARHRLAAARSRRGEPARAEQLNMIVPIDLLKPILDDLLTIGRANRPPRPWLGLFATEIDDKIVVAGLSPSGPAQRADLRAGRHRARRRRHRGPRPRGLLPRGLVAGRGRRRGAAHDLRDGRTIELRVTSGDRDRFLKGPSLH